MAIKVPNASEVLMLKNILNHTAPQNQNLRLYTNNYTPDNTTTEADFTEAAGGGYAAKSLTGTSWTIATNGSGEAEATYASQEFTFTGPLTGNATIYGYYVTQSSSGLLLYAERLANSFTPQVNGESQKITPKFVSRSIN